MATHILRRETLPKQSCSPPAPTPKRRVKLRESEFSNEFQVLQYTSNTSWLEEGGFNNTELEELDARRGLSPEEILSRLEDSLENGEISHEELVDAYYNR